MAFRTKKISQMDPKGSNLASTDLLEISQLVSGSYVTKSITGAQIAASAPAAAWGTITGTLSAQTDLNTALSGKVPTTRTLTINGTTQDLSADRTFTLSTGITIGTTAITSGTVGRVLFEGPGNVVQESANLFWDNTNGRLGIGTSTPFWGLHYNTNGALNVGMFSSFGNTNTFESMLYLLRGRGTQSLPSAILSGDNLGSLRMAGQYSSTVGQYNTGAKIEGVATENWSASANGTYLGFHTTAIGSNSILERMRIASTGNLLINTTTDAGFKLDVNGTARVSGNLTLTDSSAFLTGTSSGIVLRSAYFVDFSPNGTRTHRLANNQYGINSFIGNNIAIGYDPTGSSSASAKIELGAGTATAGTAPLKLRAGTNLTTPENGAFEYDGTNLYFTVGGVRKIVTLL